jgi:transposase
MRLSGKWKSHSIENPKPKPAVLDLDGGSRGQQLESLGSRDHQPKGTRDLNFHQLELINRVRVVCRSDGYYVQFVVDVERTGEREPTKRTVGLDVGLNHFYTVENSC